MSVVIQAEEAIFNTRVSVPQIVEQLRITHAELQCLEVITDIDF